MMLKTISNQVLLQLRVKSRSITFVRCNSTISESHNINFINIIEKYMSFIPSEDILNYIAYDEAHSSAIYYGTYLSPRLAEEEVTKEEKEDIYKTLYEIQTEEYSYKAELDRIGATSICDKLRKEELKLLIAHRNKEDIKGYQVRDFKEWPRLEKELEIQYPIVCKKYYYNYEPYSRN